MAQRSASNRGPLVKPPVLKVAAKAVIDQGAAENAPKAISHATIGASHGRSRIGPSQFGTEQSTTIKKRLGYEEAGRQPDNVIGRLGGIDAPEAGRRAISHTAKIGAVCWK